MSTTDLREIRERHSLTQRQLADLLHISQPTIARWESGDRNPAYSIEGRKYLRLIEQWEKDPST